MTDELQFGTQTQRRHVWRVLRFIEKEDGRLNLGQMVAAVQDGLALENPRGTEFPVALTDKGRATLDSLTAAGDQYRDTRGRVID